MAKSIRILVVLAFFTLVTATHGQHIQKRTFRSLFSPKSDIADESGASDRTEATPARRRFRSLFSPKSDIADESGASDRTEATPARRRFRSLFSPKPDIADEPGASDPAEATPEDMHGASERKITQTGLVGGAWCAPKKPTDGSVGQKGTIVIERDCGEDAFFISRKEHTTFAGVADGVGSWVSQGVDPRWFSWGLTNHWQAVTSPDKTPRELMKQGYERLLESKEVEHGSATAVIIRYDHNTAKLSAAVLGDSLYMIVRDGQVIFKSKEMQHYFNAPFQLHSEKEASSIPEWDAATYEHDLQVGDIVIVGSDGLFDNSEDADILSSIAGSSYIQRDPSNRIVAKYMQDESMGQLAKVLGEQAKGYMTDTGKVAPFTKTYNVIHNSRYVGGKVDDVTVLAFMVTGSES